MSVARRCSCMRCFVGCDERVCAACLCLAGNALCGAWRRVQRLLLRRARLGQPQCVRLRGRSGGRRRPESVQMLALDAARIRRRCAAERRLQGMERRRSCCRGDDDGGFTFGDFLRRWRLSDEESELQNEAEREQLRSVGVTFVPDKQTWQAWRRHLLKSPLLQMSGGRPVIDVQSWLEDH